MKAMSKVFKFVQGPRVHFWEGKIAKGAPIRTDNLKLIGTWIVLTLALIIGGLFVLAALSVIVGVVGAASGRR